MSVLLQHLWPWLGAGFAWGLVVAVLFGPGAGRPSARRPVKIATVGLLAVGALLSWLAVVPGRPGLWLDIAVLCATAYAAGVTGGALLRRPATRWRARRPGVASPAALAPD